MFLYLLQDYKNFVKLPKKFDHRVHHFSSILKYFHPLSLCQNHKNDPEKFKLSCLSGKSIDEYYYYLSENEIKCIKDFFEGLFDDKNYFDTVLKVVKLCVQFQ